MITVLTGSNDYELRQAQKALVASFSGTPEYIDGSTVTLNSLPDLLMGISLFAEERLVIIDQLSASSAVWTKLPDWLSRLSDTIRLVLVEPTLDKRTVVYKALKATADIQDFPAWTDKEFVKAEAWAGQHAKEQGVELTRPAAKHLVQRIGVDQWGIARAIDILALIDSKTPITPDLIDIVIVPSAEESAFQLLEDAFAGRAEAVAQSIQSLALSEDLHRLMGLIVSQVFSLAAVVYAGDYDDPAKAFGIHPFVVSKLRRLRSQLGPKGAGVILQLTAEADEDMKSSKAEPWVLVERLLLKIAHSV